MNQLIETMIEHFRQHYLTELLGFAAAAASLYATYVRTIIPLRIAAIVANALAMGYSFSHGTRMSLTRCFGSLRRHRPST